MVSLKILGDGLQGHFLHCLTWLGRGCRCERGTGGAEACPSEGYRAAVDRIRDGRTGVLDTRCEVSGGGRTRKQSERAEDEVTGADINLGEDVLLNGRDVNLGGHCGLMWRGLDGRNSECRSDCDDGE